MTEILHGLQSTDSSSGCRLLTGLSPDQALPRQLRRRCCCKWTRSRGRPIRSSSRSGCRPGALGRQHCQHHCCNRPRWRGQGTSLLIKCRQEAHSAPTEGVCTATELQLLLLPLLVLFALVRSGDRDKSRHHKGRSSPTHSLQGKQLDLGVAVPGAFDCAWSGHHAQFSTCVREAADAQPQCNMMQRRPDQRCMALCCACAGKSAHAQWRTPAPISMLLFTVRQSCVAMLMICRQGLGGARFRACSKARHDAAAGACWMNRQHSSACLVLASCALYSPPPIVELRGVSLAAAVPARTLCWHVR